MVVFVDLEGDEDELQDIQHSHTRLALSSRHLQKLRIRDGQSEHPSSDDNASDGQSTPLFSVAERPNPNINGFSAALSCYPYVRSTMTPAEQGL